MCGFVGVISKGFSPIEKLKNAINIINYRGPDSSGIYEDKNVQLGFNRLSIQDLSRDGDQPMISSCGRYVIVFNGEIYNYKKIRKNLNDFYKNINWHSNSDTEVLLNCISYKGIEETLEIIEGMFAFTFWDKLKNKIYLCRDHFGQKPLFYTTSYFDESKAILIASEAKAFIPYKGKLEVDLRKAIPSLFLTGIPLEGSIFKDIKSVKPGTLLEIDIENVSVNNVIEYYHPSSLVDEEKYQYYSKRSMNELVDEFDNLMKYSIKKHCISEAGLGILFSTGVDSNLITSYLSNEREIKLYHASSTTQELFGIPEKIANINNLDLRSFNIEETNPLLDLPRLLWSYEEPNKLEGILLSKLCKMSKSDGIKVLLSGCAADELFGGYGHFSGMCWDQKLNQISKNIPVRKILNTLFSTDAIAYGCSEHYNLYSPTSFPFINPLLAYVLKGDVTNNNYIRAKNAYSFIDSSLERNANAFLLDEITSRLPRFLLRNDRFSMMESIELRVPYLDKAIVSFALNISAIRRGNPFTIKHSKNGKIILRKLLEKRYQGKFRMQNFTKVGPTFNVSRQLEAATLSCEFTHLKNLLGISKDSIKKLISQSNLTSGSSLRTRYSFLSFELIMMMYESNMSINEVQNYLYDLI